MTKDQCQKEKNAAWDLQKWAYQEVQNNKDKYQIGQLSRHLEDVKEELKKADRMFNRYQYAPAYNIYVWAQQEIPKLLDKYRIG